MTKHVTPESLEGVAALAICEALLTTLTRLNIIPEKDVRDLLTDVITMHEEAATISPTSEAHREAVAMVALVLSGKSS